MNYLFTELLRQIADSFGDGGIDFDLVSQLNEHSDDLVGDLIECLDDTDPAVQAAAAFSLGHLWYALWPDEIAASSSIPKLLTLIDDDDFRVRFEATRSVSVLQVGKRMRLSDDQIVAIYLRCVECGDLLLKLEAASQALVIKPKSIAELAHLLDAAMLQAALNDAQQRPVQRLD